MYEAYKYGSECIAIDWKKAIEPFAHKLYPLGIPPHYKDLIAFLLPYNNSTAHSSMRTCDSMGEAVADRFRSRSLSRPLP